MKKIISIMFLVLLSILLLFTLTACSNNAGDNAASKELENYSQAKINDKVYGYELTINYPNDGSVTVTDGFNYNQKVLDNESANIKMTVIMASVYQTSYDSDQKSASSKDNYKEVTFGSYNGYCYNDSYYGYVKLIVGDAGEQKMVVTMRIEKFDSSIDTDLASTLDSDFVKDIAEHLVYNNQAEKYNVDGTISVDGEYYLKHIDTSVLSDYTIVEETSANGISVDLKKDDKNNVNISSQLITAYDSLDKAIASQPSNRSFVDLTVDGYQAKMWQNNEAGSSYELFRTYYVLKDSTMYMINFTVMKGYSVEDGEKLLEEFVKGLTLNPEYTK